MQVLQLILFLLVMPLPIDSMEFVNVLSEEISTPKVRILLGQDFSQGLLTRKKHIENLKIELSVSTEQFKEFNIFFDQKKQSLKAQILELENNISSKNGLYIQKHIVLLEKFNQVLDQIKEVREKTNEQLMAHLDFLEKHLTVLVHQSNIVEEKSIYSFFDFQNMTSKLLMQQEQIRQLVSLKQAQHILILREEHLLATKDKELIHIQEMIIDKKKKIDVSKSEISLLDFEKELISKEQELSGLQLNLYRKQLDFFQSKELVAQNVLDHLNEQLKIVRARLYVDMADVQKYEHQNVEQRQISAEKKSDLIKSRQEIASIKLKEQDELDRLRLRFKVKIQHLKQIEELEFQAHNSSENCAQYSVAAQYATVITHDKMLLKIKNEIIFQEAKARHAQVTCSMVKLFYEITQGQLKDSQSFELERTNYKNVRQSLESDIKLHKDELTLTHNNIKELQRILNHVVAQEDKAKVSVPSGSGFLHKKWSDSVVSIEQLSQQLQQQHEILLSTAEIYENLIHTEQEMLESVDIILNEFSVIGFWHRSMSAVTWDGIKHILPNLAQFLKGLCKIVISYFSGITITSIALYLSKLGLSGILYLFFIMFLIFFLYVFLQASLPGIYKNLTSADYDNGDPLRKSRQILAAIIGFIAEVFTPFYFWALCLGYEFFFQVPVALLILFYIYSIIFWIYASKRLLVHFMIINRKFDYSLLGQRLIERFSLVFAFFSISTIIILILRKMFIVVMLHQQTELPSILLRIYHIVIFLSIVFSLDKEEILQLLSKKSLLSQKIGQAFQRHYYLFLLAVFSFFVLSDPYLGGYGTLMWHICWNLFLTLFVFSGLFVLHTLLKQYTKFLFFSTTDNNVLPTERFDYAKTWYAIYVIMLMFIGIITAIILCAYVWGYGFTYATFRKIIMYELFKIETLNSLGKSTPESFKLLNLIYIIIVTCLGIIIAYLFKKFVLQRVFDIQYVDPGIQNTVTIISRYVIIIIAVMIACIQSKLGFVVTYVSFVGLATFGWSFKDLFTDFVAYFFILVQRPLKMGDYVKIDDETMGVVRRISPRAVILRRKNSVNIVVPNSMILKSPLYNWNYARNYIGFDDIIFCVPFGSDIELVKKICLQVLDDDHDVLKVPQPFVRLQDFADKGYVFMVRGFLSSGNTLRQWDIASNIRFALVVRLAKVGITIAGPSIKVLVNQDLKQNSIEI